MLQMIYIAGRCAARSARRSLRRAQPRLQSGKVAALRMEKPGAATHGHSHWGVRLPGVIEAWDYSGGTTCLTLLSNASAL
jgi:hypothetical protein